MGSFFKICGVTGMTIGDDDPCYVTKLAKNKHVYRMGATIFEPDQEWQPVSFPQLTKYYDYGRVDEKFEPNPLNKFLGLDLEAGGDEAFKDERGAEYRAEDLLYLVHQKVYEKLSEKSLINEDEYYGYGGEIIREGPSYFVKAINAAKELTGSDKVYMFRLYIENSHAFGWRNGAIGNIVIAKMEKSNSYKPLDQALELGLAEALYKDYIFKGNLSLLWKHFSPSNYGGQFYNHDAYRTLGETVAEIASETATRWDDE